jgi:hypothetical protein
MDPSATPVRHALITQNHMVQLAGSEMLTLELAEALSQHGYEVTVYSHAVGDPISSVSRERGILLTDDAASLDDLGVDLAWIHHQIVPDALAAVIGRAGLTVVFGHMSPFEPLEVPLLADIEARVADVVVANSEETADALRASGLADLPVVVLGNPAPDEFWAGSRSRPGRLQRLLVVSNHPPPELSLAMARLQREGLDVEHIGLSGRVAVVTPEEIAAVDAVVTIGKTVQYALAAGCPVFNYDFHGGPGWLSATNLSLARRHNFSGRPFGRMSPDTVALAIVNDFERAVTEIDLLRDAVSDLTWSHGLGLVLGATSRSACKAQPLAEPDKRRLSAHFALSGRSARAQHALSQHRAAALVSAARVEQLTEQAGALHAQIEKQQGQLHAVSASRSWRLMAPMRRTADSLRRMGLARQPAVRHGHSRPLSPQITRVDSLPALAWLCRVSHGSSQLFVGPDVEVSSHGIFEGAWVGPFRGGVPDASHAVFGSGVVFSDDGPVFVPPSHPLEALHVLESTASGTSYVSNSMCFALAQIPKPQFGRFCESLTENLRIRVDDATASGVDAGATEMLASSGYRLRRRAFFRFRTTGGDSSVLRDSARRPFADFGAYRGFLSTSVAALFENAGDPARSHRLRPVVALSKGYDSTAVAVLAAENGCREALTLDVVATGSNDSGEEIGRKLGLSVTVRSHVMGDRVDDLRVAFGPQLAAKAMEFLATEGVGDDVTFLPFEANLNRGLLLTGAWGDTLWARDAEVGCELPVRIPFGKSMTEFRLRVGCAHVPLPFLGGRAADSIAAISRVREMQEFSIGGEYDRPIPRRIGEEAGLARSDFGLKKTATAPLSTNGPARFVGALATIMRRYVEVGS